MRNRLFFGASALAILAAGSVQAQTQAAPDAVPEQVIVTGSLLGTANFAAPTPVTQVTAVEAQVRALTGIGSLVSELPYAAAGGGLVQNTAGIQQAGQSQPNLRGLGANRTLVLIDGQRPTPINSTNNFDTNLIPSSLIDRFEVVTSGASASYGSDAVAGVVNFILKDRMEGFTSDVQYGASQRGDTNQSLFSAAYGTAFAGDKGHFIIGGEFANEYNVAYMYSRPWGQNEPGLVTLPTNRAAGLPANIFANHVEVDSSTPGGLITSGPLAGIAFGPGGVPYNFPYGSIVGSTYMIGTGNYGVSGSNRSLAPPYKRGAALARVEYDITPNVSAYAMLDYGQLESNSPNIGTPFPVVLTIASGNPFIPPSIQAAMTAGNLSTITVAKETMNIPGAFADNKDTLLQSMFGLKGSIFDDWNWDLQGNIGRGVFWKAFSNVAVTSNLYAATYAVNGPNGVPVCGPAATNPMYNAQTPAVRATLIAQQYPNCVPYNIFGPNQASQAALNYILNPPDGVDGSVSNARQYMVNADLKGSPFDLPAGPLYTAFGANFRYNSFTQVGSPPAARAVFTALNNPTFAIDQSTWETYGEIGVPLVKNLPFIKSIDLNGAARYTNYSISGGVTTWKYGATWDINDSIRLRGTVSTDIRAPNFSDLANVPQSSATNITNPLSSIRQYVAGIITNGNPDLRPEVAHNVTAGVVFQPTWDWLSDFRASVDYYRVNITGVIASVSAQDVVDRCLLLNLHDYCNQILFSGTDVNTTFGISNVILQPLNLNQQIQDGFDINIHDRIPIAWTGLPGNLELSALGSYINQQRTIQTLSDGSISSINAADTTSAPRWAWNVTASYALDRWTSSLQMIYCSPIRYSTSNIGPDDPAYSPALPTSINQNVFPDAIRLNLSIAYDLIKKDNGEDLQLYLNVDNLLDKDPPAIWYYVSQYDVLGRYFKVGLRYTTP